MPLPSLTELLALFTPIITATPLPPPIIGPVNLNIQALSAAGSTTADQRHAFASLYRKTMRRQGKEFKCSVTQRVLCMTEHVFLLYSTFNVATKFS